MNLSKLARNLCLLLCVEAGAQASVSPGTNLEDARERVFQQYITGVEKLTKPEARPRFIPLPAGAVKPEAWLLDWARAAAAGITGDLDHRAAVFAEGYKGKAF